MEKRGLVRREYRQAADKGSLPNTYHFTGLIEEAGRLARAVVARRAQGVEGSRSQRRQ